MADTLDITQLDAFIPEIVAQVALGRLRNASVLLPTVTRDSELVSASAGDVIKVPVRGAVTMNDKVKQVAVTYQNPLATTVSVTLNKHKEATFVLEDVAKAMANQDALNGYIEDAVVAAAEQMDADILALYASMSNSSGVAGTDLDADAIVDVRKILTDNKAPLSERYLVMSSKDEAALLKIEKFTSANWLSDAGQALKEAFLGRRYGFNLLVHQGVVETGSSPTSTHNIAYQRGGIVVATRPLPLVPEGFGARSAYVRDSASGLSVRVTYSWNPDLLAVQCTIDLLYGVALLRDALCCEVLS